MGYYTNFELKIMSVEKEYNTQSLLNDLKDITGYSWDQGLSLYGVKWYEFNTDMRKISLKYPDVLFMLSGDGEESGDMWRKFYKNGKAQHCKVHITYEPYDEAKLY